MGQFTLICNFQELEKSKVNIIIVFITYVEFYQIFAFLKWKVQINKNITSFLLYFIQAIKDLNTIFHYYYLY